MAVTNFLCRLCGCYVWFDPSTRLYVYFILLTVLSFVSRLYDPLPDYYFTKKRNFLNDYGVKLGLFWTFAILSPFIFFTSKVYSGSNYWNVCRQLSRLLMNIFFWYVFTTVFFKVEFWTGSCSLSAHTEKTSCWSHGGHWFSFEISGHCFLLVYCSLTIVEELAVFRDWDKIGPVLWRVLPSRSADVDEKLKKAILDQYNDHTTVVQILFLLSSLLLMFWDIMFMITSLYYHTWFQKIFGLAFAGGSWYLTYGYWYRTPYSPGMPGNSALRDHIDSQKI